MWQDKRSYEKEIMDVGPYTREEYDDCLKKLALINTLLGGFRAVKMALKQINPTSILEVGCGGGYLAQHMHRWFKEASVLGIDIEEKAVAHALKQSFSKNVTFQRQEDTSLKFPANSFDTVTTMLVCHHMTDEELIHFLQESYRIASRAVVINDLQRHFLAYASFTLIGKLFGNRLIWNDGRISIKRAFRKNDWTALLEKAGFKKEQYTLKWDFAFRWTLTLRKL